MIKNSLYFFLGLSIAVGFSVFAQSEDISIPSLTEIPDRVQAIMASSSIEIDSAYKIMHDQDNARAIIKELRDVNILLNKILKKL
jgi:hypothetical protein